MKSALSWTITYFPNTCILTCPLLVSFLLACCFFFSCHFIHTATQMNLPFSCFFFPTCPLLLSFLLLFFPTWNCYFLSCFFFSHLSTVTFFPVTFFPVTFFPTWNCYFLSCYLFSCYFLSVHHQRYWEQFGLGGEASAFQHAWHQFCCHRYIGIRWRKQWFWRSYKCPHNA